MKNKILVTVFLALLTLFTKAQIAGKQGVMQGPAGFIKDVHEMERSAANNPLLQKNKLVEQFSENAEKEDRIGEEIYSQPNPMHASAKVLLIDENKNLSAPPENTFAQQKLTAQHPAYTALGNQQVNLDPSDAQIAAGPNQIVVLANQDARILDKITGAVISQVSLAAFFQWTGFVFDPRIMYDPYGQRWVAFALQNANSGCAAASVDSKFRVLISNNSDATQGWFYYEFDVDGANQTWMDFAKIGFNKDWICVSGNVRCGSNPIGLYVLNKAQAYAAASANFYYWNSIELGTPAFTYDNSLDRLYITRTGNSNSFGTGYVDSWYISSGAQLFTGSSYGTSPWQAFANSASAFPQQSGGPAFSSVNTFGHAMLSNCVYRNGSLWFTHAIFLPATGTTTRTSTQWWQVNPASGAVQQVGRIDDGSAATSEYYQSLGVNNQGDVVVTYSIFNASYYPSGAYNFRSGGDGAGTLPNGVFYTSGGSSDGDGRGGDYSQVAVDPLDDQSMWVVNQVPNGAWETRLSLIPGYYGCFTDATFGNYNWTGYTKNEASNSITSAEMIQSPSVVDYDAGGYIVLTTGFQANEGSYFRATIDGCSGFRSPTFRKPTTEMSKPIVENIVEMNKVIAYPNPATNSFKVRYNLEVQDMVRITLFSSDMKPVKAIEYSQRSIGINTETIDVSKFPSDIYFVKFETNKFTKTIKVAVVH